MQETDLKQFRMVAAGSVVGLLAIVFLGFFQSAQQSEVWKANEEAKANMAAAAEIERAKVEQAKQIADAYAKNQIAQLDQLIIQDYTLSEFPPQVNWQHSVDPTKKTKIFDQFRKCIGYAYQGQFFFIGENPTACN